jgi:bifunctional DNase/RNase
MNASVESVRVAGTPEGPTGIVLLGVEDEEYDVLPIFIGLEEASSIARGTDAVDLGRPLTHDLLLDTIEELGGRIDRIVVSAVEEGTYIADLHLETPRGEAVIDARPSDSLALAARTDAPIEIDSGVFEKGRQPADEFVELQDVREVYGPS